jgi:hypothetical protein
VGNLDDLIVKQPQRQVTPLAVGFPIVLRSERESAEELRCVAKIDAVLAEIRQPLRFVPGERQTL